MTSTRVIRVRFDPFGDICRHSSQYATRCAINSHGGCWQLLHLTNILLLGYEEVRSQDTHSGGVWAPGTLIKCYHWQ